MATFEFNDFYIYRWRYYIGYGLVGLLLVGLLTFAGLFLPGGISTDEMAAVVRADTISLTDPDSLAITNLPYSLLQAASLHLFGVHDISIKLPSLILGLLSAGGLIILLRRWFHPNIAVLASLIAVTTGQFVFAAQNGVPGILYIFWPVMLLLLATLITRAKRWRLGWKVLFFVTAALSLYTPLSIYPLIAMALAAVLHPHLRNALRQLSKLRLLGAFIAAGLILTPLALLIVHSPQLGLALLGIPTEWPDFMTNIVTLLKQYFFFWSPSDSALMTPVFGLGSVLIAIIGTYRLIKTRETTQSYLIIIWILCLIPVLIINPRFTSVTFVPTVLLLTTGLTALISYWYRLFPRNPYARILGLVPLIVLVAALIGGGIDRYVHGYHYGPQTAANFSHDLSYIPKGTTQLVVNQDQLDFYNVLERHSDIDVTLNPTADSFVATRDAKKEFAGYQVTTITTSSASNDSDRFYTYKKLAQ